MRKSFLLLAILFFSGVLNIYAQDKNLSFSESKPLGLYECYALALKQSELIAIDANIIKETEARLLQALGTLLPQVSFAITQQRMDVGTTSSSFSSPKNAYEYKFVFTQNLFSGFKEFAAIAASKAEHKQRLNEKSRAEQLLLTDVSDAFYLLVEEKEDLKILQMVKDTLIDRVSFLRGRERLGRSRKAEVVNTETQLYSVNAEVELVKSQEAVARELLEFLVGRPVEKIVYLQDSYPVLNSQQEYLAKSDKRPDVLALEQNWEISRKNVDIEKAGYLPTVSLEGEYFTARNTNPSNSKWDALLSVNIPIFEGTLTYGRVQEAILKAEENKLQFQRSKRSATSDINQAFTKIKNSISRSKALNKSLKAAQMNYYLQKQDYQHNLVNNLEVLTAIETLEASQRDYIQSFYETKRQYLQLLVTSGQISLEK